MITNRITFFLVSCSLFPFAASEGKVDDCSGPTTECCDLFVDSFKLNHFKFGGSCKEYWRERHEVRQKITFNKFNCTGWGCMCPNIRDRVRESLLQLLLKKTDETCYKSSSSTVASLGWLFTIAFLSLYLIVGI